MTAFITAATSLAPIAATLAAICLGAWLGIKAADRYTTRRVTRMVDDGLAALTAADLAADTLARWDDMRHDDQNLRVVERFVLDLSFAATADYIRRLPETQERH